MNDPLHLFDTKGVNKRFVGHETTQCFFSLTIDPTTKSKVAPEELKHMILDKDPDDFTVKFVLKDLGVAEFTNSPKKHEVNDIIILNKGDYTGIKNKTETTIGRLLTNQVLFSGVDYDYINKTFTKGVMEYHLNYIGSKVLSKDLDIRIYKKILNRFEDFGLRLSSFITPSLDMDMMILDDSIVKLRDKLIEENREAIEGGDTELITEIENELIEKVKIVYKDNPHMQHYISGGKPYLDNSYKKNSIMVGAVPADLNSTKFEICTNNYIDGLDKSDIHKVSGAMILGAYFRGYLLAVQC